MHAAALENVCARELRNLVCACVCFSRYADNELAYLSSPDFIFDPCFIFLRIIRNTFLLPICIVSDETGIRLRENRLELQSYNLV